MNHIDPSTQTDRQINERIAELERFSKDNQKFWGNPPYDPTCGCGNGPDGEVCEWDDLFFLDSVQGIDQK